MRAGMHVLQVHSCVDRDVVLDLDVISDAGTAIHVDVLPEDASFTDLGTLHDVAEVPDLRAPADGGAFVDDSRRMSVVLGRGRQGGVVAGPVARSFPS